MVLIFPDTMGKSTAVCTSSTIVLLYQTLNFTITTPDHMPTYCCCAAAAILLALFLVLLTPTRALTIIQHAAGYLCSPE